MKESLFRGAEAKYHVSGLCCLEGEGSQLAHCSLTPATSLSCSSTVALCQQQAELELWHFRFCYSFLN